MKTKFKAKTKNEPPKKMNNLSKIGNMMSTGPSSKVTKKFGM